MARVNYTFSDVCKNCVKSKFVFETDNKEYLKNINKILDNFELDPNPSKLELSLIEEYNKHFPKKDFASIKKHFNDLIISLLPLIETHINATEDPLYSAIKMCIVANLIDYSAFKDVTDKKVIDILFDINNIHLDNYQDLCDELSNAKNLVYICDNCGEIVIDKVVIKLLKTRYPELKIVAMVRGAEVVNDASMVDANQIDLAEVCEVIDNGLDFAGTDLKQLSKDRLDLLENADLIISKGQGNAEFLLGCGLNIYYLFLVKCANFEMMFNVEKMTPMLEKERII